VRALIPRRIPNLEREVWSDDRMRRSIPLAAAAWLSACSCIGANVLPVENSTPYRIVEGSVLIVECIPCDGPPVVVPVRGRFRLLDLEAPAPFARHAVLDLSFAAAGAEPTAYRGKGEGEYALGGEVALIQEMRLEVMIEDQPGIVLVGEPAPVQTSFPWIEIDLVQTPKPELGSFYRLHLVATPWARLRFSTLGSFHAGSASGSHAYPVSRGDLLAPEGWIVRTQEQLTANLGLDPSVTDLGLDAAFGASRVDPSRPHAIHFSMDQDVLSETLGLIQHGDLVSEAGAVVRTHADLLRLFVPQPPLPNLGLDAFVPGPNLTTLFSIEEGFFSERLGVPIDRGDVLADNGSIFRTSKELLSNFAPIRMPEGGVGLDGIHLWHHGELWFSVEESFEDARLGHVGHGDILSDTGRIVVRNLELLGVFAPLEDLADFGLDGLWIDNSPFLEDCGVLVPGVECLLFRADGGGLYLLDRIGEFEAGDRVHVMGIVDAKCSTFCQEVDGCIANESIRACGILPCERRPCGSSLFHRSDVNDSGRTDISDGIFVLAFLFTGGPPTLCSDAADANDDDAVNIADPIHIFGWLFLGGPIPPPPGPPPGPCGHDPTTISESIGCETYTSC
jgi:hypothetical protein